MTEFDDRVEWKDIYMELEGLYERPYKFDRDAYYRSHYCRMIINYTTYTTEIRITTKKFDILISYFPDTYGIQVRINGSFKDIFNLNPGDYSIREISEIVFEKFNIKSEELQSIISQIDKARHYSNGRILFTDCYNR